MPTQKDFKRLVRRRMQKTGESYTAARARLLQKSKLSSNGAKPSVAPATTRAKPAEYATLAGMTDAAIEAKTGCDWKKWVYVLDRVEAHTWPHRKIAEYVRTKYSVPDWWTQAVTVGYERIRGLREIGQRRGGGYEATKSRTFAVPVATLYAAFAGPRRRARWLPGVKLTVRKATPDKSIRITWNDGTSVEIGFLAKGPAKSSAAIAHVKLPSRESASKMKAFWSERLDALAELLA